MATIDEIYNAVQYQNDLITFSTIAIVASIAVVIGISLGSGNMNIVPYFLTGLGVGFSSYVITSLIGYAIYSAYKFIKMA